MKKAALVFVIAVLLTACQKDKHLCVEDIDNFKPAPATIEARI
ncbi:MAG TPA: hypothetical protein PK715_03730 [Chitinophagales bacterium]|nr:hypothetical protein [Chitinophagales bacterium]